jgi:hypothetical protein
MYVIIIIVIRIIIINKRRDMYLPQGYEA